MDQAGKSGNSEEGMITHQLVKKRKDISDVTSIVTQYLWLAKSDQNKRND